FRMLCAAWDAEDRKDREGSDRYRAQAADFLEVALGNRPDARESTDWTIQQVDILRRLGRFDEAEEHCDRLIGHASPKIDAIGRLQLRLIMESDTARYTMGAALEEDDDG